MRRLLLALVLVAALAGGGAATPASTPTELGVDALPAQLGFAAEVDAFLTIAPGTQTARVAWYVPLGYTLDLSLPAGTKVGTGTVGLGAGVFAHGDITVDDPAKHAADVCAPGTHAAVWVLSSTVAGQPFALPIYVDAAAPPASSRAAFQLRACFDRASPPARVELDLTRGIANPSTVGGYLWRAVVTPYDAAGAPEANHAVEAQALVPLPHTVTAAVRYDARRKRLTVRGVARAGGAPDDDAIVWIYTTLDLNRPQRRIGTTRTDGKGTYTFSHALTKTSYVVVRVPRLSFGSDCDPPIGSSPCTVETIAPSDPAIRRVVVR